jgi:uncharacterized protein (DUF2384 family)
MRIEKIARAGREFAVLPMEELQRLIDDAERGDDDIQSRLRSQSAAWPARAPSKSGVKYRGLTPEQSARTSKVSRVIVAAIEAGHKNSLA